MKTEPDTKQRILEAAHELISQQSYGAVSVDDICAKAGVRKGSFYHFFPSKSDLAVAAIEEFWQQSREKLDNIFSPQTPPLERIAEYCEAIYQWQKEGYDKTGKVCGCPYASIGSEQSTQDEKIRCKSTEIFERMHTYLEAALRDAMREGLIAGGDVSMRASEMLSLVEGTMLQAKVQNSLEMLRQLKATAFRFLGVLEPAPEV